MDTETLQRLTRVSRRRFIGVLGLGGLAVGMRQHAAAQQIAPPLPVARPSPWPIFRIARPEDHLCVEVELVNLRIVAETGAATELPRAPRVHIASHGESGYIVLRFPGQHYAEQAVWDRGSQVPTPSTDPGTGDPPAPVTYPLWRWQGDWIPAKDAKTQKFHHKDDLAFLRFAPWIVPEESKNDTKFNEDGRRAQELDREHRSRWWFPQWKNRMDGLAPKPWLFPDLYRHLHPELILDPEKKKGVGGDWNHKDWTRGMAGMWVSGPSQVVFEVPQWRAPFPCDTETILRLCTQLDLVVAPQLDPGFDRTTPPAERHRNVLPLPDVHAGHHPGAPAPVTAIEFPTLLYLSPYANARWRLRPTVAGAPQELWALELEPPRNGPPAPGTPRERREPGHLFAFARRDVEEARWPQDIDGAHPLAKDDPRSNDKYSPYEAPKTTLYEATRRLLVLQLREDNGDITAEHFALTGLGASAHLRYRPLLEPQGDEPVKEAQLPETPEQKAKRKEAADKAADPVEKARLQKGPQLPETEGRDPKDEGLLTEWIQKTDLGRDYYSKEAFVGWWMPWGFKAESVTITERLPATDPWVEFTHGGARMRPHNLLQRAGWNLPEGEYIDLEGHEANLIALLVARKFARVKPRYPKAGLIRYFGAGETEDFLNSTAEAARTAGIVSVEILVERTPVLANQYCAVPDADFPNYIKDGLDLRVAGGTGKDAGREIFLPRVRDFARGEKGELVSRLIPYRFPMRFTYRDGRTEVVEMPMLFVPTPVLGQQLYDQLPADLRTAPVKSKIAFVDLPSPGAVNPLDLGPAADLSAAKAHLAPLLPGTVGTLLAKDALAHSGSLTAFSDGLNAFIDGPAAAITRLLSSDTNPNPKPERQIGRLGRELEKLSKAAIAEGAGLVAVANAWRGNLAADIAATMGGYEHAEREAREILSTARRFLAWGVEEIVEVDHLFAAERLERFLRLPEKAKEGWGNALTAWKKVVDNVVSGIADVGALKAEGSVEEINDAMTAATSLRGALDGLKKAAEKLGPDPGSEAQQTYSAALRFFLVQWAAHLGGRWKRHVWDAVFHFIARTGMLPANEQPPPGEAKKLTAEAEKLTAVYKKRLQTWLLKADRAQKIVLRLVDEKDEAGEFIPLIIDVEDVVRAVPAEAKALAGEVGKWLESVRRDVERDATTVERLLRGVDAALGDERGLRLRLHRAIEDLAARGVESVKEDLDVVFADVTTHITAALTHARDGRARFERFVRQVEATPEMVAAARDRVLAKYDTLRDKVRGELTDLTDKAEQTQKTIERLLVTANPEQLRQKLEDVVDLAGLRLRQALRAQFDAVFQGADGFFQRLQKLSVKAEQAAERFEDAAHEGGEALLELEKLFRIADEAAGELRETLATVLRRHRAKILAGLGGLNVQDPWLDRALALMSDGGRMHSWRLGQAAVMLIEDLLREAESIRGEATDELAKLRRLVLSDLARTQAVTDATFRAVTAKLHDAAFVAGKHFQVRAQALREWATKPVRELPRIPDQLGYLLAAFLAVRRRSEAQLNACLGEMLKAVGGGDLTSLAKSELRAALEKEFPEVNEAIADVRRLVGEVEDIPKALTKLTGQAANEAQAAWKKVQARAASFATAMKKDLKASLAHVEGQAYSLAKRALVSLPAPAMLRDFQDQTRKAIFESSALVFQVRQIGEGLSHQLAFPKLQGFRGIVPGLPGEQTVQFAKDYVNKGLRDFEQAAGAVFGELTDGTFNALRDGATSAVEKAGLVQAQEKIQELSREYGAVAESVKAKFEGARQQAETFVADVKKRGEAAIADIKKGIEGTAQEYADKFRQKAEDLLPAALPKLLDSLPLDKILGVVKDPSSLPKMISKELPDRIERSRTWKKTLTDTVDAGVVKFQPGGKGGKEDTCDFQLDARAVIHLPLPGRDRLPPAYSIRGQLGVFDLTVAEVLLIHFRSLSFTSENGSFKCTPKLGKAELTDVVDVIEFQGPLRFLEDIRRTLGQFLAELPFRLQIRDDYIFAGFTLPIPGLGFGAFSITGISFRTALGLPLGGGPLIFRFAISDKQETFKVAVCMFGGEGFFALELSSDPKKTLIEGAIGFGGTFSLSFAVVEGELSVMAGIYFRRARTSTVLDAYFRACGRVTVFGFIEISILIMVALGYRNENGASLLYGSVVVRIRVKIGFFSKSFSFQYKKKFAGSGSTSSEGTSTARWLRRRRWDEIEAEIAALPADDEPEWILVADRRALPRVPGAGASRPRTVPTPAIPVRRPPARGPVAWRWGAAPWPTAGAFPRPAFARAPRFSESMTPGDWGSYWRLYRWEDEKAGQRREGFRRTPNGQKVDWQPLSDCHNHDLHPNHPHPSRAGTAV